MNYSAVSRVLKGILASAVMCTFMAAVPVSAAETEEITYTCRKIDMYDYQRPVPMSMPVDESYYDQAFFAGDSRMGSLYYYGTHPNRNVAFVTSLSLIMIKEPGMKVDERDDGVTLWQLLEDNDRKSVYLLFGINEIRNPNFNAFGEMYQELVDMLRKKDPDMDIYVILSYHPDLITNLPEPALTEHLNDLNSTQVEIAKKNHLYYLNPDEVLNDAQGTIIDEYVWDGLHFNPTGTKAFQDFIDTHVVRRETYVKEVCE